MKRRQLVELEDLPWWPRVFRDALTDYLATALRVSKAYAVVVGRLADAVKRSGSPRIVDLCSGGGGPWLQLLPGLRAEGVDAEVWLTDLYPNVAALTRTAAAVPGVRFAEESVSALDVPKHLVGFRTLFSSFHHFPPPDAKAILASAVRDGQGIAIFEATMRTPAAIVQTLIGVPIAVWLLTPLIRPFRWSRLFWTYLLPVVPLAVLFDGTVSCLRTYNPDELRAMGEEVGGAAYDWEAGIARPARPGVAVTYLIGMPRQTDGQNGTER